MLSLYTSLITFTHLPFFFVANEQIKDFIFPTIRPFKKNKNQCSDMFSLADSSASFVFFI